MTDANLGWSVAFIWRVCRLGNSSFNFYKNRNDDGDCDFVRIRIAAFTCGSEQWTMNGLAEINSANQDALFALVTPARPLGLTSKRVADVVLALCGIVLLAPLLAICFAATACFSPGPVLFRHKRVGFNGKPFYCLKFRTMAIDAPERLRRILETDSAAAAEWIATRKLRNDPRVTMIGAILRKSSLDELPQLFNVLKGDMSIVGPRPITEDELGRYADAISAYCACRPGITGLWQVSGRSTTTFQRRVVLDSYYTSHWSMALDAKIIVATIPAVCFSDTAY